MGVGNALMVIAVKERFADRPLLLTAVYSTGKDGIKLRFEPDKIVPKGQADDPEKLVDHLLARVLVVKPRTATRDAIVEACRAVPAADRAKLAARLILASPEYQVE